MMKRQQRDQLRQKAAPELRKDVDQAQQELVELKMKSAQGSVTNVRTERQLRQKIAQLKSLLQAKDLS